MPAVRHRELEVRDVKSLAWHGEELIDWVSGARTIGLDGRQSDRRFIVSYDFDSVATSPSGDFVVVYQRLGTKGIVLRNGEIIRELNRSYYFASSYDYPIALGRLADGREVIIHCPDRYNQLEVELLATGERLTERPPASGPRSDFFHSGLVVDPTGTWLMSAGWLWHPFETVRVFSLPEALRSPTALDHDSSDWNANDYGWEVSSAAFFCGERLVVAVDPDAEDLGDPETDRQLHGGTLASRKIASDVWEGRAPLRFTAGRLLPVDDDHVLTLHDHPRLVALASGEVVEEWPQIASGTWRGCVNRSNTTVPAIAWDFATKRLAVASPESVHLLELSR